MPPDGAQHGRQGPVREKKLRGAAAERDVSRYPQEKNLFKWVAEIVKGAWATGHLQSVLLTVVVALGEFLSVRFGAKFLANFFAGFDKRKTRGKDKDKNRDDCKDDEDASFTGA